MLVCVAGIKSVLWEQGFYLPKEWSDDKQRCLKAGIPREEQKYRTKPELGLEIIKELEGVIEYNWVGGDTIYGNSPDLRQSLRRLGKAYVLDVGEELQGVFGKASARCCRKTVGKGVHRVAI
jgi:SRSO17 transposase